MKKANCKLVFFFIETLSSNKLSKSAKNIYVACIAIEREQQLNKKKKQSEVKQLFNYILITLKQITHLIESNNKLSQGKRKQLRSTNKQNKVYSMILIKSVAQPPPQVKKQDQSQVQKFITILEQKQQRYLNVNENKFLLTYLSQCPLLKDMPNKHIATKTMIQHGQFFKLEKGEALPNTAEQKAVTFVISGRLECQSLQTQRDANITSMQSTLNSKETQQMTFSAVYNMIESADVSNIYSNDISSIASYLNNSTTSKSISRNLKTLFGDCDQPTIFSINKPFNYNNQNGQQKESVQIKQGQIEDNIFRATSACYLIQMELKEFLSHFDLFLKQILFISQSLLSSPFNTLSNQSASILSTKFKEQYFFSKTNVDLTGDILIVKQGSITIFRNSILTSINEGETLGLEFYDNNCSQEVVSISTPLVCYILNKLQYQYINQIYESLHLPNSNKQEIRCNSALNQIRNFRSMDNSRNNSQLLNQNSQLIVTNAATTHSKNHSLLTERYKINSQFLKPIYNKHAKRNSVVLEPSNDKSPFNKLEQQQPQQQIIYKNHTNFTQARKSSIGHNSNESLPTENILSNKIIISQLLIEEDYQNGKLINSIAPKAQQTPPKLTNSNRQVFQNQMNYYNFIKRNPKGNFCVKDALASERLQKTPNSNHLSKSDLDTSQFEANTSFSSPLKNISSLINTTTTNSTGNNLNQQEEQNKTYSHKLNNHSFYQYPMKTEQIRGGSHTDRPMQSQQFRKKQQQNIITITSYRSKSKNSTQRRQIYSQEPKKQENNFVTDFKLISKERQRSQENIGCGEGEKLKQPDNSLCNARNNHFQHINYLSQSFQKENSSRKNSKNYILINENDNTTSTQEGECINEEYIQLKQKYEKSSDKIHDLTCSPQKNNQFKYSDQKYPKLKKRISQYKEIQQELQWESLKNKLMNDLINKKLDESEDREQQYEQEYAKQRPQSMRQSSKQPISKQHELNILSYILQNSNENSPSQNIVNSQPQTNSIDYFEVKEQRVQNGVHINSLHLDYNPQLITKYYLKQQAQNKLQSSTTTSNYNFIINSNNNNSNKTANNVIKKDKIINSSMNSQLKNNNSNNNLMNESSSNINRNQYNQQKVFIKNIDISQNPSILIKNTYNSSRKKKIVWKKKQENSIATIDSFANFSSLDFKQNS